jgi:hypothetical protein
MSTPTRKQVLKANQLVRLGNLQKPRRLDCGYTSMRIPEKDFYRLVKANKDLIHADRETRMKAWKQLEASPLGNVYRVTEHSPAEVKAIARRGNKGIIIK